LIDYYIYALPVIPALMFSPKSVPGNKRRALLVMGLTLIVLLLSAEPSAHDSGAPVRDRVRSTVAAVNHDDGSSHHASSTPCCVVWGVLYLII